MNKDYVDYDDFYYGKLRKNSKKGYYLQEQGKPYVLFFMTEKNRKAFIDRESKLYDFRYHTFEKL